MNSFLSFKKKVLLPYRLAAGILLCDSVIGAEDFDIQRPHEMICPITRSVMQDPVVAADGYSYEKAAIQEWFRYPGGRSPRTGLPLDNINLIPNFALKMMIREWTPKTQGVQSAFDHLESSVVVKRIQKEFTKHSHLLHSSRDRDIVVFLGNTGAGKSTLVNLLSGKKLYVNEYGQGYTLANQNDQTAMPIGATGDSQTLYPKSIAIDNNLFFFDLPGFNDIDGSERNLVNAAFIKQILIEAASVRFVFVAGEDEFTVLRGEPIKKMFNVIRLLFVEDQGIDLINNGVFVTTKSMCRNEHNSINYLLQKVAGSDKEALQTQLQNWIHSSRLCHMHHPVLEPDLVVTKNRILTLIKNTSSSKILGVNISVLYPSETKHTLIRMFFNVMQKELKNKIEMPLTLISEYDHELELYSSENFWEIFDVNISRGIQVLGLLKQFDIASYDESIKKFKKENEPRRQEHIQILIKKRQARVLIIEQTIHQILEKKINDHIQKQHEHDFISSSLGHNEDFYNRVCDDDSIKMLTIDPIEQEMVHQYCADFINNYSPNQMLVLYQRFIDPSTHTYPVVREQSVLSTCIPNKQIERISRPIVKKSNEALFQRFMAGSIIYRPTVESAAGQIVFPIASIVNPLMLEGTFDLSRCGDVNRYLSISIGFRRGKIAANANKIEVWIVPKFMAEQNINGLARHLSPLMSRWSAPYGIFFTWGNWHELGWYDYETAKNPATLNEDNLSKIASTALRQRLQLPLFLFNRHTISAYSQVPSQVYINLN